MTDITTNLYSRFGPTYTLTQDGEDDSLVNGVEISGSFDVAMEGASQQFFNDGVISAVLENGYVVGAFGVVVAAGSTDDSLYNEADGYISALGDGVWDLGASSYVGNFGTLSATEYGIRAEGTGGLRVFNTGNLSGSQRGIYDDAQSITIDNTGSIFGGVSLNGPAGSSATITNSGMINGVASSLISSLDASSKLTLTNTGTMEGSVVLGDEMSVIRNTGKIVGDLKLGGGNDHFDGRGGTVTGEIFGGAGNDVIHNGADGGYVLGEAGHDTLYANAGADIFEFYSHASTDWDTIHGFDVKHDKIQLDALDFDGLTIGKAPTFVMNTKATSAADHLFYNASTGSLHYDADGSGTSDKPELIARMDKGLALTASDFKIV